MKVTTIKTLLVSIAFLARANAQLEHFSTPITTFLGSVPPMGDGNAVALSPDESLLVTTSRDGSITGLNLPSTGQIAWSHKPPMNPEPTLSLMTGTGGVTFSSNSQLGNYMVYAVRDGLIGADPSACRVVALDYQGNVLWTSDPLEGGCSGTPVVSGNGEYVFLTHNLVSSGKFTVLMANMGGQVLFVSTDLNQPFSPPGIFFNPDQGYYDGGLQNRNDILLWSYRPFPGEVGTSMTATFGFQFPVGFDGTNSTLSVLQLLSNSGWQSESPPKIFNNGFSAAWSVSRNQVRTWNGQSGNRPTQFDRQSSQSIGFTPRGTPPSQPIFSSPALSSDPVTPNIYVGTAIARFVALDNVLNELWTIDTANLIFAEAIVSPDDAVVYFAELNGLVHATDTSTGMDIWTNFPSNTQIRANFAMSANGFFLYIGDSAGSVYQVQVATGPTPAPTPSPTMMPTTSPSAGPSVTPGTPSSFPSGLQTAGPSAGPTLLTPTTTPSVSPVSMEMSAAPVSMGMSAAPVSAVTPAPTTPPTLGPTPATPQPVQTQATDPPTSGANAAYVAVSLLLAAAVAAAM